MNFDGATRASLIAAGLKLFHASSVAEVMVEDIAREAGVTKKVFYKHFRLKENFIAECYRCFAEDMLRQYQDSVARHMTARAKIAGVFAFLEQAIASCEFMGCGFLRAGAAIGRRVDHPLQNVVSHYKKAVEGLFCVMLEADGYAEPRQLARELMIVIDGTMAQIMYHRDRHYMMDGARLAMKVIDRAGQANSPRLPARQRASRTADLPA